MKKTLNNKITYYFVIVLVTVTIYMGFMNYYQENNFLFSIIMPVVYFYSIYVFSFFLELIIHKIIKIAPVKYFVVYPFSYDGILRFKPFELLYNQESINNVFFLNLVVKRKDTKLKNYFKLFLIISYLCKFIAIALISFLFFSKAPLIACFLVVFLFLCYIIFDFINVDVYQGNTYVYLYGSIQDYFIKNKCIREITENEYIIWLSSEDSSDMLLVLENYIYKVIKNQSSLLLEAVIKVLNTGYQDKEISIINDLKLLNNIKLIGQYGMKTSDLLSIELSKEYLIKHINYLIEIGFLEDSYAVESLNEFVDYLSNNKTINVEQHLIIGVKSIFDYIEIIETKIL